MKPIYTRRVAEQVSAEQHMQFPKPPDGKRRYIVLIAGGVFFFLVWYGFLMWMENNF